jgi:peptidoglycan L-alanyl-D-glutamate endopeptidase CwlK
MYKFSPRSLENLRQVHPDLQFVVHAALETQIMDFSVIEGVRESDRQKLLFSEGKTKTLNSKHLIQSDGTAHAVDLYPYPINMKAVIAGDAREILRFGVLSGIMMTIAKEKKITLVHGADWDGDGQTLDHTFFDAPHFQLVVK